MKNFGNYVDWLDIIGYDTHGSWDVKNKRTGPCSNSYTSMMQL